MRLTNIIAARARFTDDDRVHRAKSFQKFLRDDQIRGFALRVTLDYKTWIWEGRIKGRVRRIPIGLYPDMQCAAARAKAEEIRGDVAKGIDPGVAHDRLRHELTFKQLAARYLDDHAKLHRKTWKRDATRLAHHFPSWNNRVLSDVSKGDVAKALAAISNASGPVEANRAIQLVRAVFNKAAEWKLFDGENPAASVQLSKEQPRERFLSPAEVQRVNQALINEPDWRWRAYFPLCLMLGTRRNELLSARWSDINLEQRSLHLVKTKSGKSLLLPLSQAAFAIVEGLPSREVSEWLFPGSGKTGHLVEVKSAWKRIKLRAGVEGA